MIFHGYVKLPEGRSFHLIGLQVKSKASQLFSAVEQRFAEQLPNQLEEPAPRRTVKRCGAGGGLVKRKKWGWVNTYRYIFSGMNIHLPAILGFTRGTRVLTHPQMGKIHGKIMAFWMLSKPSIPIFWRIVAILMVSKQSPTWFLNGYSSNDLKDLILRQARGSSIPHGIRSIKILLVSYCFRKRSMGF